METQEHKKLQRSTYENLATSYDLEHKRENRNHINKIKKISNYLSIDNKEKVLEIGVGTGIHADYLLRFNNANFKYYGIDYSQAMINQANLRLGGNNLVFLSVMDGEKLAFLDESFDKVYVSGSLHHFHSPQIGLQELFRVLKKGGRFCVMEPNYYFPTNLWAAHCLEAEHNMKMITRRNLNAWLNHYPVDFNIENFAYTPPFPKFLLPVFNLLDRAMARIPLIKCCSVMFFISGKKR